MAKISNRVKLENRHDRWVKATAVVSIIWTCLLAAVLFTWMFKHFIHEFKVKQILLILSCIGMGLGAALVIAMGIYEAYYAIAEGIDCYSSIALGIWFIIITGIIPGIMYFICYGIDKKIPEARSYSRKNKVEEDEEDEEEPDPEPKKNVGGSIKKVVGNTKKPGGVKKVSHPVEDEEEPQPKPKKKRDPRTYFVEDENDTGLVPTIKRVKFEDLDEAVRDEEE